MVGTVTYAGSDYSHPTKKLVMNWTSDASGNATVTTTEKFTGDLISVQHIAGAGGSAPTDAYDVVVNNSDGIDILGGTGANITVATGKSSQAVSSGLPLPSVVGSTLALSVSNAGDSKTGKVVLIFANAHVN